MKIQGCLSRVLVSMETCLPENNHLLGHNSRHDKLLTTFVAFDLSWISLWKLDVHLLQKT